jgi:D-alanyl-D-alanine dipeptidase
MTPRWDRTKGRPEPIRALNRIAEVENGEPLVEITAIAPSLKIIRPQVIPYVRETVARMVHEATLKLPNGIYLGLVEGWRPIQRQQRIYDFMLKSAIEAYPNRNAAALRRTVCRWVAPTDQKAPPGHCTGAAVDVWLVDEQGKEIDIWSPLKRFQASPTFTFGIDKEHWKRRMMLYEAMVSVGFSNCRDEWWHYSYGDAGWAVRTARETCCYGLVTLEPSLYEHLEAMSAEAMKKRPNPFLPT